MKVADRSLELLGALWSSPDLLRSLQVSPERPAPSEIVVLAILREVRLVEYLQIRFPIGAIGVTTGTR
eukprot:14530227-Alexandrium_andersonii.AAC.1